MAALSAATLAAISVPTVVSAPAQATTFGCPTGWTVQRYVNLATLQDERYCIGEFADTVGTKSWTVPPGVTSAEIIVVGGGGGGGSSYVGGGKRHAGGGGGGGEVLHKTIPVTPGDSWTVTTGAGGAASTAGGTSSVVKGATSYTAVGGGAGADATSSAAGAGGSSGITSFSASKVTYNGGSALTSGSAAAAGGGAGAGQKANGASAEIGGSFEAYYSQLGLSAINHPGPDWPGLTSGCGGSGYTVTMATEGVMKQGYNYFDGTNRLYNFGAGGGGGQVGDKVDELTAQGGNAEFGDTGSQPAGRGGQGSNTGTADAGQNAKPSSGGGGGGGGSKGTVSQAGGTGASGLVVITYVAYVAALDLLQAFDTEAGYDAWNAGTAATPLALSPAFDPDKTSYQLYVDPLATSLWFATSPFEDLGRVTLTTSGPEVVTSPATSSGLNTGFKIQGVQVGTTVITVKAYSRDDVAVETYRFKIKVPITPPDPGSRALTWGSAGDGALGDNQSTDDRTAPVLVDNGANTAGTWSRVDGGYDHSCGLGMDNKAYCWGANGDGQLGDGGASGSESLTPVLVSNGDNTLGTWKKLDAGYGFNCGIGSDNKGYCWGSEDYGRLGDGASSANRDVPGLVVGGANVPGTWKEITAGSYHACGIAGDNKAYCWGYNSDGELGDSTSVDSDSPVLVVPGDNTAGTFSSVSAGYDNTCGLGTDGEAYCWGYNYYGEVGDGSGIDYIYAPSQVADGENTSGTWKAVSAGYYIACGIGGDDMAYCWGYDYLGTGAADYEQKTPVKVDFPPGTKVESLGLSDYAEHVCAIADGAVWCWGGGSDGQLGDDTASDSLSPVKIALPLAWANAKPLQIATGASHSLMVAEFTETKTAPGAPTVSAINPLDRAADVVFTAGTAGTAPITNYQYKVGSGPWMTLSPADTTSPIRIPGLTNFTTYTIKIRAVSADGNSAASNELTVTPVGPVAPGAPTITAAKSLDGAASLKFTAGAAGSAAVTNYQYRLDNGPWTALSPADIRSPLVITGLTNGVEYKVRIRAVSSDGVSAASNVERVKPGRLPGTPIITTIESNDRSAAVTFEAGPEGHSPTLNYEYQLDGGKWVAFSPASTTSPLTITGLTNGTTYSVRIRAVSADGTSAASNSENVKPGGLPGAPFIKAIAQLSEGAVVTFAKGAAGRSPTINHEYQLDGGAWIAFSPAATTSPVTIGGLTTGTTYRVRIRAVSVDGAGAASNAVTVTPGGTPSEFPDPVPTELKAGDGEILLDGARVKVTVTVNAGRDRITLTGPNGLVMNLSGRGTDGKAVPVDEDGALILSRESEAVVSGDGMKPNSPVRLYMLSKPRLIGTTTADAQGGFTGKALIPKGKKAGDHVIQAVGLTPSGKQYHLSLPVRIVKKDVAVAPSAVRDLAADVTTATRKATVTWRAPAAAGGATVSGYVVSYRTAGMASWSTLAKPTSRTYTMRGLTGGCLYDVRVAAVNSAGRGPWETTTIHLTVAGRFMPFGDLTCRLR